MSSALTTLVTLVAVAVVGSLALVVFDALLVSGVFE